MTSIVCTFIVSPLVGIVNFVFSWLHKPLSKAIASSAESSSGMTGIRVVQHDRTAEGRRTPADIEMHTAVVARRRPFLSSLLPYCVATLFALISIWITASISRSLSSASTIEWLKASARTLAVKWGLVDPVKVIGLAPIHGLAQRHRWSKRIMACVNALCMGSTEPHKFRNAVTLVMQSNSMLKRASLRLMLERVERDRDREIEAMTKAQEDIISKESSEEVRRSLRAKHQRQRQELLDRVKDTERELTEIVDGRRSAFDSVVARPNFGEHAPDTNAVQNLMQEFSRECDQVMMTVHEQQEEARQVRGIFTRLHRL